MTNHNKRAEEADARLKARAREMVECSCGASVQRYGMSKHLNSQRHIRNNPPNASQQTNIQYIKNLGWRIYNRYIVFMLNHFQAKCCQAILCQTLRRRFLIFIFFVSELSFSMEIVRQQYANQISANTCIRSSVDNTLHTNPQSFRQSRKK